MNEDVEPVPVKRESPSMVRRIGIYALVLLLVFLLGFVPMWLKARGSAAELAEVQKRHTLALTQNSLASAVIDARRGDYEPARQSASQFFTSLLAEVDKGEASSLTDAQRTAMQPIFTQRDEIITLLARSDPASADRLSDVYASYRKIMGA